MLLNLERSLFRDGHSKQIGVNNVCLSPTQTLRDESTSICPEERWVHFHYERRRHSLGVSILQCGWHQNCFTTLKTAVRQKGTLHARSAWQCGAGSSISIKSPGGNAQHPVISESRLPTSHPRGTTLPPVTAFIRPIFRRRRDKLSRGALRISRPSRSKVFTRKRLLGKCGQGWQLHQGQNS